MPSSKPFFCPHHGPRTQLPACSAPSTPCRLEKATQLTKAHVYFARNGGLAAPTFWP